MKAEAPHFCFLAPRAYPLLAGDNDAQIVGGAELQQVLVARGLADRGFRVSMICLDHGQEDLQEIDGITVYRAFRPRDGIPGLRFVWPRMTSIWRCLKQADADIYYHRTASAFTGLMAAFCQRHRKKSVFAAAGEPMIRFARDRWLYEYGVRHVDRVFVQNRSQARFFLEHMGRESILVPNCVSVRPRTIDEPRTGILWVSTIRNWKRPWLFLDIAKALPQFRFVMVGGPDDNEQEVYAEIEKSAAGLDNVTFVGFVPYEQVDSYFARAKLFVNTSESEGFPNSFLQAWLHEVPTVSFVDCGAQLAGEPIGQVVSSIEDMTRAVESLMTDDRSRATLGSRSRQYVETSHGIETVLDLYEKAFRELLDAA